MKYRVNIDNANTVKSDLSHILDEKDKRVLNKVGAFASLFLLDVSNYNNPVLVLKTEEPGSKQVLAFQNDRVESVCFDMIHHLINDCIAMGAEPLAVQDLIVCSKLDSGIVKRIVSACALACQKQGCILTGGETTEQPDVVPDGTYILGSSIVGIVEKEKIIDGSSIKEGDIVIGISSSGLHTNGYTLVRDLLKSNPGLKDVKINNATFLDLVLVPHKCYYSSLKELFHAHYLKGLAHITGGGIKENLNRILPSVTDAVIDLEKYQVPEVFTIIKKESSLSDEDMLRTFNMGIGLAAVCSRENSDYILKSFQQCGETASIIGNIVQGSGKVVCKGKLRYLQA